MCVYIQFLSKNHYYIVFFLRFRAKMPRYTAMGIIVNIRVPDTILY